MPTNLVISGGPGHDFEASTAALVEILAAAGIRSEVVPDPHEAFEMLAQRPHRWDLVTVNALRWTMATGSYGSLRSEWAFRLENGEAACIDRFVRSGGGLLACHSAVICFDGDPTWSACLGAAWNWSRSSHPPLGPARIDVAPEGRCHPLTEGLAPFTTVDEVYGGMDVDPSVVPLLTSSHGGGEHPVLWARSLGRGRVVVDLLGHDAAAVTQAAHGEIIRRAGRWLTEPHSTRRDGRSLDGSEVPR